MMRKPRKTNTLARLADVLNKADISVDEIAKRSGVERSLIYKYKKNEQSGCTLDTLERLMDAIGAHPSDVLGEREREPEWVVTALERLLKRAKGKG